MVSLEFVFLCFFLKEAFALLLFLKFSFLYFSLAICSLKYSQIVYGFSFSSLHFLAFGCPLLT